MELLQRQAQKIQQFLGKPIKRIHTHKKQNKEAFKKKQHHLKALLLHNKNTIMGKLSIIDKYAQKRNNVKNARKTLPQNMIIINKELYTKHNNKNKKPTKSLSTLQIIDEKNLKKTKNTRTLSNKNHSSCTLD